jgi:FkbM family methyltransferase
MIKPGFLLWRDERLRERYFSINEMDRKLECYLDFDGGFFIEAGSNDGINQSNTLYFEKTRNWRGLLIEPVPDLAWRCRAVRPGSLTLNVALGSFEQRGTQIDMTFCNLMSAVDGALATVDEQRAHIELGAKIQNVKPYRLSVRCEPLSDLIDRYGIRRIDLLSLDVEGYEENALRGLELTRHRPRYMLIEARYRQKVESVIGSHYDVVGELTERDILYRARKWDEESSVLGWRYSLDRGMSNMLALSRWYG